MRQFILENQKIKNGIVVLSGKDYRYLRQVLRVKTGDMLNVRFPDGSLQSTTVASVDDKSKKITIQVCDTAAGKDSGDSENQKNSGAAENHSATITRGVQADEIDEVLKRREYWLFQFIPKPQKFELIVRQATECGIRKIIPVIGEYSEKSSVQALLGGKKERLERVIKEARQQSGSSVPTEVLPPVTLDEALKLWSTALEADSSLSAVNAAVTDSKITVKSGLGLVLSERTDKCVKLSDVISAVKTAEASGNSKVSHVAVAVGSEGGISPSEIEKLYEKNLFYPIHFVVNILRCETAALYGIAAVQSALE